MRKARSYLESAEAKEGMSLFTLLIRGYALYGETLAKVCRLLPR
jgi:hypothetical protein